MTDRPSSGGAPEGESTEIATSTLAEIYEKQGLYDRAIAIWRKLARRAPGDVEIAERIEELDRRLEAARMDEEEDPGDEDGETDGIAVPGGASPVPTAADASSSIENEAARTGPPEDAGFDPAGGPGEPARSSALPVDEDSSFRAWLENK